MPIIIQQIFFRRSSSPCHYMKAWICVFDVLDAPRQGLFFVIPVNSLVATFKQSENVTIAHLVRAAVSSEGMAYAIIGSKSMPLPSAHARCAL